MTTWFSKNLGDGVLGRDPLERVQDALCLAFAKAGRPAEVAAFFRYASGGRLHCTVTVYLPPASEAVAMAVGAKPCASPPRAGRGLLAGSDQARDLRWL